MSTGANLQGNLPCIPPIKGTVHKNGLMSPWRCQWACVDHTEWISLQVIEWNCLHNYFRWIENQQPSLGSGNKPLLKPYGTILRRDVITGPLPSEILSQEFLKGVTYVWEWTSSFLPPVSLWKSDVPVFFTNATMGKRCKVLRKGRATSGIHVVNYYLGPGIWFLKDKVLLAQWNMWFVNTENTSWG